MTRDNFFSVRMGGRSLGVCEAESEGSMCANLLAILGERSVGQTHFRLIAVVSQAKELDSPGIGYALTGN